jgi:GntR family transcriptional regulator
MSSNSKLYFQIATASGVPIYRQIIDQVKTHIATGRFKPEDFLPSVRQVASELEVNPMTISKAYSLLEKEGVLEYVRGKGMRISASEAPHEDLKEREEAMKPLLREVITKSSQLALGPDKISKLFADLWKETENE